MGLDLIPQTLRKRYTIDERDHACAILSEDFPEQFKDILDLLRAFTLKKSYITVPGGARSPVSEVIDGFLSGMKTVEERANRKSSAKQPRVPVDPIGPVKGRGWKPKQFQVNIKVDDHEIPIPTHEIDNFKVMPGEQKGVGIEVEWNNKDPFYDRDLTNFRLLRNMGVLSVGVIITRMSELQQIFAGLGKGSSYGNSTTHWNKLIPRLDNGTAGGCPILVVGMGFACYDEKS